MKKKYYAVRLGRDGAQGVYDTWEECKALVHGVPGAVYKSFFTREEAEAFIAGENIKAAGGCESPAGAAVAYVDGSYDVTTGAFSCGAVLFWQGETVEFSKKFEDEAFAQMHNVAGEIMGAVTVIRWCLANAVPAVEICHDYEGVGKWADGLWKTNREGTRAYADFVRKSRAQMKISFVKVRGHSGDVFNDRADRLAKDALGIE